MRGRKPQPTKIQVAKGDPAKRGKGKLQEKLAAQPNAARGLPKCPDHLQGRARASWESWAEDLEAMTLDARPDGQMLEGACVAYARAVEADIQIAAEGAILWVGIFSKNGDEVGSRPITHPAITISNMAWRNVRAFCSEFGLSPVSRTRLSIEKKDDEDADLQAQLRAPRADIGAIQ